MIWTIKAWGNHETEQFFLNKDIYAGLNFIAFNLKDSQIIGDIIVYNLWKFQIDRSKIEITMNIFFTQKV